MVLCNCILLVIDRKILIILFAICFNFLVLLSLFPYGLYGSVRAALGASGSTRAATRPKSCQARMFVWLVQE